MQKKNYKEKPTNEKLWQGTPLSKDIEPHWREWVQPRKSRDALKGGFPWPPAFPTGTLSTICERGFLPSSQSLIFCLTSVLFWLMWHFSKHLSKQPCFYWKYLQDPSAFQMSTDSPGWHSLYWAGCGAGSSIFTLPSQGPQKLQESVSTSPWSSWPAINNYYQSISRSYHFLP